MDNCRAASIAKQLIDGENPYLQMGELKEYHMLMLKFIKAETDKKRKEDWQKWLNHAKT